MNVAELVARLQQFPLNARVVMGDDWNAPLLTLNEYEGQPDPTLVLGTVRQQHLEATPREAVAV